MPKLEQGRIVWARMRDPNGRNEKNRAGVIITPTDQIVEGSPFVVVAITGTFSEPLDATQVKLPWHRNRDKVRTRLTKPAVAKCDWLVAITHPDIIEIGGVIPQIELLQILQQVRNLANE